MLAKPLYAIIGWRYLRSKRREGFISLTSWFALIGIALGVATLILVTSLMNGIALEMRTQLLGIGGHINVGKSHVSALTDYQQLADKIKPLQGVLNVSAKIEGQVMATANSRAQGAQVIAIPAEQLAARTQIYNAIKIGRENNQSGLILGEALAANLGVKTGDMVTLISPQGRATIAGVIPRLKAYPVVGIIKLGMHFYDSSLVIMPFSDAQVFFQLPNSASNLDINLTNISDTEEITNKIQNAIGYDYMVWNWQQSNSTIFTAHTVQRNVMLVILTLIVFVAAFNIISMQMMLVKEKSRDIAILRTIGASRMVIAKIFMLSGLTIGAIGTFFGVVLGLILAANIDNIRVFLENITGQSLLPQNIYFLSNLPTKTDISEVLAVAFVALLMAFLASLYPAMKASKLNPVEALRYE